MEQRCCTDNYQLLHTPVRSLRLPANILKSQAWGSCWTHMHLGSSCELLHCKLSSAGPSPYAAFWLVAMLANQSLRLWPFWTLRPVWTCLNGSDVLRFKDELYHPSVSKNHLSRRNFQSCTREYAQTFRASSLDYQSLVLGPEASCLVLSSLIYAVLRRPQVQQRR